MRNVLKGLSAYSVTEELHLLCVYSHIFEFIFNYTFFNQVELHKYVGVLTRWLSVGSPRVENNAANSTSALARTSCRRAWFWLAPSTLALSFRVLQCNAFGLSTDYCTHMLWTKFEVESPRHRSLRDLTHAMNLCLHVHLHINVEGFCDDTRWIVRNFFECSRWCFFLNAA